MVRVMAHIMVLLDTNIISSKHQITKIVKLMYLQMEQIVSNQL